jgi:hypothetical protein
MLGGISFTIYNSVYIKGNALTKKRRKLLRLFSIIV